VLQPTSPFVKAEQIDKAIDILLSQPDADAVTSIVEVPHVFHPYNIRVLDEDGSVRFFMPKEHERFPDRQSKPKFYAFGNLYVFRYDTLVTQRSLYGRRCLGFVIDSLSAFDVNEPQDLATAECLLKGVAP
jgi:CMP-N-acetylneuraminic acid synthetase